MEKDYSLYIYYKGSEDYPNKKAAYFGFYENNFENIYKGTPDDKEKAFKDYMSTLLHEKASDMYQFGLPQVDKSAKMKEFLKYYFNPHYEMSKWWKIAVAIVCMSIEEETIHCKDC